MFSGLNEQLPVHLYGKARELEEGMGYRYPKDDGEMLEEEMNEEWLGESETL